MSEKKIKLTKPKRKAPSTAFKKGVPNPHAFQPGNSANLSGRSPLEDHLLSKHTRAELAGRAPAEWCRTAGLPETASKGQCLAAFGIKVALRLLQENDLSGLDYIARLTEPKGGTSVNVGVGVNIGANGAAATPDKIGIVFVSADGNGNVSEASREELAAIDRHYEQRGYRAMKHAGSTTYVLEDGGSPEDDNGPVIEAERLGPE